MDNVKEEIFAEQYPPEWLSVITTNFPIHASEQYWGVAGSLQRLVTRLVLSRTSLFSLTSCQGYGMHDFQMIRLAIS